MGYPSSSKENKIKEVNFILFINNLIGSRTNESKDLFKHLQHTPALDDRIREKSQKIEKYLDGKCQVKWTCYVKNQQHYADVELIGPTFDYHASGKSDSLYKSLDKAIYKLESQLIKKRKRNKLHRKIITGDIRSR